MAESTPPQSTPKPNSPQSSGTKSPKLTPSKADWENFLPVRLKQTPLGTSVRIIWPLAALWLILLGLISWIGLATGAYLFVKYRRDFSEVQFKHMLFYPAERENYRVARGDYLIALSQKELEAKKFREAFYHLRVGASMAPRNRDGRMLLAQFYVVWQRPDLAHKLLAEGLEDHAGDQDYLQATFSFLLQRQEDYELIQIADRLLASSERNGVPDERLRLIATARATAQFFRGNYDAAEDTIREYRIADSIDGRLLAVRVAWARGERESALAALQSMTEELPDNEQVYAQYTSYLREGGRDDELRRQAVLRQLSYPDRPRARVDLLYLYNKANEDNNLQMSVEDLFRDFGANGEVMLALGDFAANTGRPELARRVYDHCKVAQLPWDGAALMTVEAYVVAKRYREALEACTGLQKENPEWGKRFYSVFNGLQAIANFGLSDVEAAELFLSNFLAQSGVRAENLVAVSNRLLSVGADDQARLVLAQAVRADPLNQTALTGLIRLDLAAGRAEAVSPHIETLLTTRTPPRLLLREAYDRLASDRFLLIPQRATLLNAIKNYL